MSGSRYLVMACKLGKVIRPEAGSVEAAALACRFFRARGWAVVVLPLLLALAGCSLDTNGTDFWVGAPKAEAGTPEGLGAIVLAPGPHRIHLNPPEIGPQEVGETSGEEPEVPEAGIAEASLTPEASPPIWDASNLLVSPTEGGPILCHVTLETISADFDTGCVSVGDICEGNGHPGVCQ